MIEKISTHQAAPAIGPYSQACRFGQFVFTSGQIPLTPEGELVEDDIEVQTHQVFKNIQEVLKAAGTDLQNVIKVTIFMKDINEFSTVNEIYASYFGEHKPARSTVQVAKLPKDVKIEIEMVAIVP